MKPMKLCWHTLQRSILANSFMLKIESDNLTDFIIEYENGAKRYAALGLRDNGWMLMPDMNTKPKWIAGAAIEWPEALKRSLIIIV
jgi:hypothetical protein